MAQDERRKILAGARLRKLRNDLGISQSLMANEIGVSISYLNLIERNLRPVTAQILIKLSETYGVDPSSFAQSEEIRSTAELEEILADPVFHGMTVPKSEFRALSEQAPALAEAVKRVFGAYTELRELGSAPGTVSDRGDAAGGSAQDTVEQIRHFLQETNNHFPDLEETADQITKDLKSTGSDVMASIHQRLQEKHDIRVQIMPINVMGRTLRRFDIHRRKILISELVEPSGRMFQVAFHLGLLEAGAIIDKIIEPLQGEQVRRLARVSLANYFAGALMMPYQEFLGAAEGLNYDVEVLSARFSASFEQVAHRLTTLSRANARGVPFFMIRVDNAGNVSKRFSSGSFPFAKFGGTCPRWNIHNTFRNPGRIETQIIELPDGAKWFSISRTVRRVLAPWGDESAQFVVGLGCELKHASRLVYAQGLNLKDALATPIGVNCRLCERTNCIQRAAPAMLRPLNVNENIRGFSPFDADLTR
jgi:XRE family transcriptional regulator, fatty acid utilization regulator